MFSTQPWLNGGGSSWITTSRGLPSRSGASVITSRSAGSIARQSEAGAPATIEAGVGGSASSAASGVATARAARARSGCFMGEICLYGELSQEAFARKGEVAKGRAPIHKLVIPANAGTQ